MAKKVITTVEFDVDMTSFIDESWDNIEGHAAEAACQLVFRRAISDVLRTKLSALSRPSGNTDRDAAFLQFLDIEQALIESALKTARYRSAITNHGEETC